LKDQEIKSKSKQILYLKDQIESLK